MKGFLTISLTILAGAILSTLPLLGQFVINPYAFASSSTPWSQTLDSTGVTEWTIGGLANRTYAAFRFTAANTGTVDSVTVYIDLNDAGMAVAAETFDIMIYADSGAGDDSDPTTQVANALISNIAYSSLSTTIQLQQFNFTGTKPQLTASTIYWIVFRADQISADVNFSVGYDLNESVNDLDRSTDGTTWTQADATALMRGQLDGTTP